MLAALTPWPTDGFSWSANSQETDLPQAQRCWSSLVTWQAKSIEWYNANIANKVWPMTVTTSIDVEPTRSSTTIYPSSVSTYTLCGSSPRANVAPVTHHSSWITTVTETYTWPAIPEYSVSQPCEANEHYCRLWYYDSNIRNRSQAIYGLCGLPAHLGEPCLIGGGPVRLIYWPVAENHACGVNHTFANSSALSLAPTVTTLGTTFTSGSVYLSLKTLYAFYDGFFQETVGPTFADYIVPLSSAAISTHCGGWVSPFLESEQMYCTRTLAFLVLMHALPQSMVVCLCTSP